MKYNDARPVLLRIARLEERLKEKPPTRWHFLKDSSKVLSISAFVISIVTTVYSWSKDEIAAHEAARREFDSTIQQSIDMAIKTYNFQVSNKNQPNYGAMNGWFNTQSVLLQNKALLNLAALHDASMFDYTVAANILSSGQPARAEALLEKAIEMGLQSKKENDQFLRQIEWTIESWLFGTAADTSISDEEREHDLANAYTSLGQVLLAQKKGKQADKAFEAALQMFSDKNTDNVPVITRQYMASMVYKFWADAEAEQLSNCNLSLAHLQKAANNFPEATKLASNSDWTSLQYELSYATTYCGADGILRAPEVPASPTQETAATIWPSPSPNSR